MIFERFVSFNNNSIEVARIDTSNGRLIFPNLSSISSYNTPIYFSGTGTNYIASGASTVGFFTGNNTFSVSPTPSGEIIAKINNVNILHRNIIKIIKYNIFHYLYIKKLVIIIKHINI